MNPACPEICLLISFLYFDLSFYKGNKQKKSDAPEYYDNEYFDSDSDDEHTHEGIVRFLT